MAWRLTVFVNQMLASKTWKMTGSLLRSYWTWEWQRWKLSSCSVPDSICESSFVLFYGGSYTSSVGKKASAGYQNILYSCCRYESLFYYCFCELRGHLDKQWFLWKVCQVKKCICILYVIQKIICFRYWAVQWVYRLCRNLPMGKKPWR